jgi:hypothetical protein
MAAAGHLPPFWGEAVTVRYGFVVRIFFSECRMSDIPYALIDFLDSPTFGLVHRHP